MTFPDWWHSFVGAALGGATTVAVLAFVAKEWSARLLDRQAERFRHKLAMDATTQELLLRSQIEFKERQLAEFYGPIYAYLKRGAPIFELLKARRLLEVEDDIRALFRSANDDIVRIILTKSHLIQGPRIPESFTSYLAHVAVWHANLKAGHPIPPFTETEFPQAFYPNEFDKEIFATTEKLKKELDDLRRRSGLE